ncbi:MAG: DUF4136 domain-containing protein, partial [Segetibacter sp.]
LMWVTMLALGALFTGCTKDPVASLTENESRIYITNHDSTVNFSAYKTFSVSDSVAVIKEGRSSKEITATDQAFINAVKAEMQARGFTLVSKGSTPTLGINVSRIYNTSTGVISYNNYYNNYGGYYDPYYWGYGGYGYYSPYSYATYSITEGALSVDILDLKDAASTNRISVIWTGLIRGSAIFNSSSAQDQVKMLFTQSPYLKNQ